ncbi:DUF2878 domain-containing protein [Teredinibacter turnerae]|uniref:DUF2878 domain-containing protein n=1 Tax=Teredinibacter turnerae TaxID=2426 RepID=UPI0005F871AB|nr:DUF2878 domain-containing protein [Teredinibacter turnerae]
MVKRILINSILFQGVWWVAVQGNNTLAVAALAVYFLLQASFLPRNALFWGFCFCGGVAGWLLDSALAHSNIIHYQTAISVFGVQDLLAPVWLLCIWLAFMPLLLFGLRWLMPHLLLAALLGFALAPLSYIGGAKFANASLNLSLPIYYLVEGVVWALVLPGFLSVAAKVERAMKSRRLVVGEETNA